MWRKKNGTQEALDAQAERATLAIQLAEEQTEQVNEINAFIAKSAGFLARLNLENNFSVKMEAAYRGRH